mmetsp:Transcript_17981/g.22010  ORF Transcript_17981/g.22010 Transcript_17981/m.22010 type:complete len:267 (-) Transcript_17981:224-1024(-)
MMCAPLLLISALSSFIIFPSSAFLVPSIRLRPSTFASSSSPSFTNHCTSTKLLAKKQKRTLNKSSEKSGGGFGSSTSSSSNTSGKTRSVSGYTGSGTKPLRNAANTFDKLSKKYGREAISDLYVRSPLNDPSLFWYAGKVVRRLDIEDPEMNGSTIPTEFEAVISQKRLILEYAKNQLRPQNFGGPYSKRLEVWVAPGDTEMDVVQNKISLVKVTGSIQDLRAEFSVNDVGFNPEIYVGDEAKEGGLRVKRDENGHPVKDVFEINA